MSKESLVVPNHNDLISVKNNTNEIKKHIDEVYSNLSANNDLPYYLKDEIDVKLGVIQNNIDNILDYLQSLDDRITALGG